MSQKRIKQIRKQIRKEEGKIKIEGLTEFMNYARSQSFFKRLNFALKIIFRGLK